MFSPQPGAATSTRESFLRYSIGKPIDQHYVDAEPVSAEAETDWPKVAATKPEPLLNGAPAPTPKVLLPLPAVLPAEVADALTGQDPGKALKP